MVDHPTQRGAAPSARQDTADETGPGERIAKALARAGVASRREVERFIEDGRVAINGKVLDSPAVKVMPDDILTVDGQVVGSAEATRLWRYHKPAGLMTTHSDPQGRPTVFEHLPEGLPRVISIGRLDLASEGLLLLTNDGELSRGLELPATGWVRRYRARAYGHTTQAKLDKLKDGIVVEGVSYGAIEAKLDKAQGPEKEKGPANLWITVSLTEGKNREVRRVLEAIGLKVNRLIRLAYGPFALGTLEVGQVEEVGPRVIREQLSSFIAPENLPKGDRRPGPAMASTPAPGRRASSNAERAGPGRDPAAAADRTRPKTKSAEPVEKKEYKPGWAKPKTKARPHPAPNKAKSLGPGVRRDERRAAPERAAYGAARRDDRKAESDRPAWTKSGGKPRVSTNPDGSRAERKATRSDDRAQRGERPERPSGAKFGDKRPPRAGGSSFGDKRPAAATPPRRRPPGQSYGMPTHGEAHERAPWDAPKASAPSDKPPRKGPRPGPSKPRKPR